MTTPQERTRAVCMASDGISGLAAYAFGKSETVRVPRAELRALLMMLRHYPTTADLSMTAEVAPHLWGKP